MKRSIKVKLIGGFILLSLVAAVAALLGEYNVSVVSRAADEIFFGKFPVADMTMESSKDILAARNYLSDCLSEHDLEQLPRAKEEFAKKMDEFDRDASAIVKGDPELGVRAVDADSDIAQMIKDIQGLHDQFQSNASELLAHHEDHLRREKGAVAMMSDFDARVRALDNNFADFERSLTQNQLDPRVDASMEAKALMYQLQASVVEYMALESSSRDELRQEILRLAKQFEQYQGVLPSELTANFEELVGLVKDRDKLLDVKDHTEGAEQEARQHMTDLEGLGRKINDSMAAIEVLSDKDMHSAMNTANATQKNSKTFMAVVALLALALGIGIGAVITRDITRPIAQCVAFAQRLATGDLTASLTIATHDETSVLAHALNTMVGNLRGMVERIRVSSESVASAAEEIAAATNQIAQGAQDQASASEETSASMEQMSVNIQSIAGNTDGLASSVTETSASIEQIAAALDKTSANITEVNLFAGQAKEEAQAGGNQVMQAVAAMKTINGTMSEIMTAIQNLGQRSAAIGSILEVIEEIAEQTNLLALNAAIEAARAGDAGRGFAVVADEVRKLAERSAESTQEIGEVIKEVQAETSSAVKVTEEGARGAREAAARAEDAGEGIQKILELVHRTSHLFEDISTAIKEQAGGVQEVVKAAENMSRMTEEVKNATQEQKVGGENVLKAVENIAATAKTNLSAVEQLSRAARDMADQSEGLQQMVKEFKLRDDEALAAVPCNAPAKPGRGNGKHRHYPKLIHPEVNQAQSLSLPS